MFEDYIYGLRIVVDSGLNMVAYILTLMSCPQLTRRSTDNLLLRATVKWVDKVDKVNENLVGNLIVQDVGHKKKHDCIKREKLHNKWKTEKEQKR